MHYILQIMQYVFRITHYALRIMHCTLTILHYALLVMRYVWFLLMVPIPLFQPLCSVVLALIKSSIKYSLERFLIWLKTIVCILDKTLNIDWFYCNCLGNEESTKVFNVFTVHKTMQLNKSIYWMFHLKSFHNWECWAHQFCLSWNNPAMHGGGGRIYFNDLMYTYLFS